MKIIVASFQCESNSKAKLHPTKEDFVTQIAMQTNGLTEISKADCEKLVQAITAMLEEQ